MLKCKVFYGRYILCRKLSAFFLESAWAWCTVAVLPVKDCESVDYQALHDSAPLTAAALDLNFPIPLCLTNGTS